MARNTQLRKAMRQPDRTTTRVAKELRIAEKKAQHKQRMAEAWASIKAGVAKEQEQT
jgi:hypothetical protein